MPVGGVTIAGCKRQAWHSSVRSSSIQRDERDAPRSAQEPQQLETIDVVWHEDQIYVAGTFNRRLCMYRPRLLTLMPTAASQMQQYV